MGRKLDNPIRLGGTMLRAVLGALLGAGVCLALLTLSLPGGQLVRGAIALAGGGVAGMLPVIPEARILFRL